MAPCRSDAVLGWLPLCLLNAGFLWLGLGAGLPPLLPQPLLVHPVGGVCTVISAIVSCEGKPRECLDGQLVVTVACNHANKVDVKVHGR